MMKILFVFGTRPEAIKCAPLIHALKQTFQVKVCITAQHRQMLDTMLDFFDIHPDHDLNLMRESQTLSTLTADIIEKLSDIYATEKPDVVFVQGDTTTAFSAALAAFYAHVPVAHLEAGLRSHDMRSPYPEEMNRKMLSQLASWHFCPTAQNRENLLKEGICSERIFVTGNTVIDALQWTLKKVSGDVASAFQLENEEPYILITGHRRENFGETFEQICLAIAELCSRYPEFTFIYPVHLNPNVQKPVHAILSNVPNMRLIDPVPYPTFVYLMQGAHLILSDSGGIQEEAPSLNVPILVLRNNTERPEGVATGAVKLIGTDRRGIVDAVSTLLDNPVAYQTMVHAVNPYGDGTAAQQIHRILRGLASCT